MTAKNNMRDRGEVALWGWTRFAWDPKLQRMGDHRPGMTRRNPTGEVQIPEDFREA
jgi:hypothetical protein